MKQPITFRDALLLAFIVLKLCGVIHWHWAWVLSPVWIGIIVTVIINLLKKEDKPDEKSTGAQRMEEIIKEKHKKE